MNPEKSHSAELFVTVIVELVTFKLPLSAYTLAQVIENPLLRNVPE